MRRRGVVRASTVLVAPPLAPDASGGYQAAKAEMIDGDHDVFRVGTVRILRNSRPSVAPHQAEEASLFGMAGISFLVSWVAAWIEAALSAHADGAVVPWRHGLVVAAVLAFSHGWGSLRMAREVQGSAVRVAAVGTTATFGGFPVPVRAERDRILGELLADTARASDAGARLAVWTEASTVVEGGAEEEALLASGLDLARRRGIEIVMAYIVPRSENPPSFENKYAWVSAGGIRQVYEKHHPAPGEPAVVGTGPLAAVDLPWGRVGGAICYDYDYPAMALEHARLGVGLVALPSSGWRGIDPIHTQMAAMRAVEGGFSLVRSTRFGLSGAADAHGRFHAWRSSFEGGDRVLLAELPVHRIPTPYALLGDTLVWACLAGVGLLMVSGRTAQVARAAGAES